MRLRYYNSKTNNIYKFYIQYLQIRNNTIPVNWISDKRFRTVILELCQKILHFDGKISTKAIQDDYCEFIIKNGFREILRV